MHPLFDDKNVENPEKASSYIYKAFNGDFSFPIAESINKCISHKFSGYDCF
ncbi:MAG: hypothetical protein LBD46_09110 [Endomicrobium sp.]|jgi:type I restriction enzyme M protein|nr:hypothetical protein [Endomicrobium sp.]